MISVRKATAADAVELGRMGGALTRLHHGFDAQRFLLPADVEKGYAWWLAKEAVNPQAVVLVGEVDGGVVGYTYGTLEERLECAARRVRSAAGRVGR